MLLPPKSNDPMSTRLRNKAVILFDTRFWACIHNINFDLKDIPESSCFPGCFLLFNHNFLTAAIQIACSQVYIE